MPPSPPRSRSGFTLLELLIVIGIVCVLAAVAVPNYRGCGRRSSVRACYANQKTIAGAIEMYNLDFNTNLTSIDPQAMKDLLQKNGYLQSVPRDPGQGRRPGENYELAQGIGTQNTFIFCRRHGPIQSVDKGPNGQPQYLTYDVVHDWLSQGRLETELRKMGTAPQSLSLAAAVEASVAKQQGVGRAQGRQRGWVEGLVGASVLYLGLWLGWLMRRRPAPPVVMAPPLDPSEIRILGVSPGLLAPPALGRRAWRVPVHQPGGSCPVCSTGFEAAAGPAEDAVECPTCETPHHRECRDFLRGCAIYACAGGEA